MTQESTWDRNADISSLNTQRPTTTAKIPSTQKTIFQGIENEGQADGARRTGGRDRPRLFAGRFGSLGTGFIDPPEESLRCGRFWKPPALSVRLEEVGEGGGGDAGRGGTRGVLDLFVLLKSKGIDTLPLVEINYLIGGCVKDNSLSRPQCGNLLRHDPETILGGKTDITMPIFRQNVEEPAMCAIRSFHFFIIKFADYIGNHLRGFPGGMLEKDHAVHSLRKPLEPIAVDIDLVDGILSNNPYITAGIW